MIIAESNTLPRTLSFNHLKPDSPFSIFYLCFDFSAKDISFESRKLKNRNNTTSEERRKKGTWERIQNEINVKTNNYMRIISEWNKFWSGCFEVQAKTEGEREGEKSIFYEIINRIARCGTWFTRDRRREVFMQMQIWWEKARRKDCRKKWEASRMTQYKVAG